MSMAYSFEAVGRRLGKNGKIVRTHWIRGMSSLRKALDGPPGGSLKYEGQPFSRDFADEVVATSSPRMERSA